MATINNINNRQVIDYMARDYNSFKQAMIDLIPEKLPNWTDRSEADFGVVLIELFAHMADILSYYQDRIANESFLATAQERRSVIQHLRLIGYELAPASPASALLTLSFVVDNDKEGTVKIRRGDQFCTRSTKERPSVIFEYVDASPLVINLDNLEPDSGGIGKKKFESGIQLRNGENAPYIPVQEGRLIENELLGISGAKPNQRYTLAQPGLIRGSLGLQVEKVPWNFRETLVYSRADDEDYTLQTDENDQATIIFGDGVYGKIPPRDAKIVVSYRTGGGRIGNVPAKSIDTITKSQDLTTLGAKVWNENPATGGEERESLENAIRFAPLVFKSNRRAITVDDFVSLAKQFPGVAKARAVAGSWNCIKLYIAPTREGFVEKNEKLVSDVMKKALLAYFEDKRMMTTQIEILEPDYVWIYITARVTAKPFAFSSQVKAEVQRAVGELLNFDKVDFKATLFLSKVYEAIEAIPGVDNVFVSEFLADRKAEQPNEQKPDYDADKAIQKGGRIELEDNQIPIPGYEDFIKVTVEGGLENNEETM